MLTGNTGSKL